MYYHRYRAAANAFLTLLVDRKTFFMTVQGMGAGAQLRCTLSSQQ